MHPNTLIAAPSEYESTPAVQSQGLMDHTEESSINNKELRDVKKRISMLMGNPTSLSSALASEAGPAGAYNTGTSPKTESESIG